MTPSPSAPTLSDASGPPRIFDPVRREARLRRSAALFAGADFLHRRAAENAAGSLEAILRDFPVAVDLSAQGGVFEEAVLMSDAAQRIGPVVRPTTLSQRAAPGAEALPVEDASANLIVSLLTLHWANDLPGALSQIRRALKPDGMLVQQSESPLLHLSLIQEMHAAMREAGFAETHLLHFPQMIYPSGWWSGSIALKQGGGLARRLEQADALDTQYYNRQIHDACFALPTFVRKALADT